jgi:hypothetical protein
MNKSFAFMFLGIVLVLAMVSGVSAKTLIAGKIYNADFSDTISGANVTITCDGNVRTKESSSDGTYSVTYLETGEDGCDDGDSLTVSAVKGDLYGSQSGTIHNDAFDTWDLAIVNVPLVPEFGLIAGLTAILGSLGIFFFVRKN